MAIPKASTGGAAQAPKAEPNQAPKNEPRKPQDNTGAKQAPKEMKQAVTNSFGNVPKSSASKTLLTAPNPPVRPRANLVLSPRSAPAGDPKLAQTGDSAPSPVDPQVQSLLDTRRADGKTVKEKLDADSSAYLIKAAQDHFNLQREKGEAPDAVSRFYLNSVARDLAENGAKDLRIPAGKLADVFDADKIRQNIEALSRDPAFKAWISEQQANSIQKTIDDNPDIADLVAPLKQEGENDVNALRRTQSDYLGSAAFADAVATAKTAEDGKNLVTEGMKALSSLGLGEKEMQGVVNTLTENIRSKYNPDAPKAVIDPATGKAVATEDGYNLAKLPDGTYIAQNTDGKPVADKQGNPYVYNVDRTARVDPNNAYVQYDPRAHATYASYGGIKYLVGPDGTGRFDAQGNPLVVDNGGGAPVALGADGKVGVDAQGNKAVIDPDSGKAVVDPQTGNKVVIDAKTRGIVQVGADGKVVADENGDPYAADQKSGGFVKDAAGRYVRISKENVAPGIVPGYVVDGNNTRVVVSPINGKPLVDPRIGKTVIFSPGTNSPELVPLDAGGKPQLSEDGKNIVYDLGGNTVVKGGVQNWLVTSDGKYANDGNGHYIGVGARTGITAPVDAKGKAVPNSNGHVPLWAPKSGTWMFTADGTNQVVLDKEGNLLEANREGQTVVEEKTGLPYLIDPKTKAVAVNPDTGRSILLDTSGAAIEYNADTGTKYLINPVDNKTVKTVDGGLPIVIDDKAAMPVAVNADGSKIRNPYTGNTVVYNIDGKPAVDAKTGVVTEITANGKAYLIDPKTQAPIGSYDKSTGGQQLYNKDGTDQVDPNTGNKVQIDANGQRVEVDAATGKFATDANGNTLILGPGNTALKTPDGNAVVVDKQTGAPIAVSPDGKTVGDPDSTLPRAINTDTGKALEDPVTKVPVVVDAKTGAPVQVDPGTGQPVKDPMTGLNIVADAKTGAQLKGPNGEPVGVAPGLNVPVYLDKQNNTLTLADPQTGKAVTNPTTGARVVIDPQYGVPIQVLPDKDGKLVLVDDAGRQREDGLGNKLYLDQDTGQVVMKLPDGKVVDARTIQAPEKADPKQTVTAIPYPPRVPPGDRLPGKTDGPAGKDAAPAPVAPPESEAIPDSDVPYGIPGPSGATNEPDIPARRTEPWAQPGYRSTPEDRAAFASKYNELTGVHASYESEVEAMEQLKKQKPELQNIPTDDLVAVRAYTRGKNFAALNEALVSGDAAELLKWEPYIKTIQSGLNQLRDAGYAYNDEAIRWMKLNASNFDGMFQEGGYFRNKQFLSASADPNWTWHGNVKVKFEKFKGVIIESLSPLPSQREVLGDIDALFKTKKIDNWPEEEIGMYAFGKTATVESVNEVPLLPTSAADDVDAIRPDPLAQVDEAVSPATKAVGKWRSLGKVLGYAGEGLAFGAGILQAVLGGLQVDDGVRTKNPYDIAAGALNITSGALGIGSSAIALFGGAAAAAAIPLAGAAAVVGMVALIVDILKHKDDHTEFANSLGALFGSIDIFKEGWHEKAAQAYYNAHSEPDPAPIAHGNLP